jgi:crotonobetainyl-CoA:carnitine CoA-transferase CaiB-like acyl-CoA transferase
MQGMPLEVPSVADRAFVAHVSAIIITLSRQYMLANVRVLDLTRVLAGPLCTMLLGDLGADVIKIERPRVGDDTRGWGPPFDDRGQSAYFLSVNRNKWSVATDLDTEEGQVLVAQLAAEADIVVDNFRPRMLADRGLGAERLLKQHPRLIWCTISGFGSDSDRIAYDFIVQAEQGWMAITGDPDGPPFKIGVALADVLAGKDAAIAILAALVARDRGHLAPEGRHISVSLAHSATAALVNVAQNVLVSGNDARRWGNAHPNLVPYQLFDAADRHLALGVGTDAQWRACMAVLDLTTLATDPVLATNPGRLHHRDRIVSAIADRVRQFPAAHWVQSLTAVGVPCGLVRTVREALADIDASALTGIAPSVPGCVRFSPPRLDQHGPAIRALGWGAFAVPTGGP